MGKQVRLVLMILFFLGQFGCKPTGSWGEITPSTAPESRLTASPTAFQPTRADAVDAGQATPQPGQTRIASRQSTAAAASTQVANRGATATARIIQATVSAPTPDWIAIEKKLIRAVMAATSPRVNESRLSPDGQWRAEVVRYDCVDVGGEDENAFELLFLVPGDVGEEKTIADQLRNCGGLGAAGLGIVYWSADSHYLYYTESAEGVPDGDATAWYRSLFRYDLSTDETIELRWGPLAPDGVTMAYPDPGELALYIWDQDRGEIAHIPSSLPADSPGAAVYGIAWSPDGKSLVYIEAENAYTPDFKSRLVRLDLATFAREAIYQSESGTLCCVEWRIPGQIQFQVNYEPQRLDLPLTESAQDQPASLWCERPDDLAQTRVAITRLPGAPRSFCIVWEDRIKDMSGYRVELNYLNGGESFHYLASPHGKQWIVPLEYQPRLDESQEQFLRRSSFSVHVYALRPDGEILVGGTGMDVDNLDLASLPTATPAP